MKQTSKHRILNRIAVSKEAFIYLQKLQRSQRGCKPLTDEKLAELYDKRIGKTKEGFVILEDGSCGGGDGTYYGRWTSWSCEDLKTILNKAGYTYIELEAIEQDYINVYL